MRESTLIGHTRAREYLGRLTIETLPHTLLITGPRGVGKMTLASELAARSENSQVIVVNAGADPKTGTPRAAIPVQSIRDLRSLFNVRHAGPLFIIIERAEELHQESSNALLKIMEEPGGKLYFIILARSEEGVLQTIRSRSARISLTPVPTAELRAGLQARGYDAHTLERALAIAEGRPGVAIRYIEDIEFRERVINEQMRFSNIRRARRLSEAEALLSDLFGKKDRHIEARAELVEILEWWMLWLSAENPAHPALEQIAKTIPLLSENMHPRLLMERIVIALQS